MGYKSMKAKIHGGKKETEKKRKGRTNCRMERGK